MDRSLEILVVDDDEAAARVLQTSFEIQGHRVLRAVDALEALEAMQARALDAAVIDIGLPGINGLTLAKLIRAEPACRDICLIALGATAEHATVAASLEAGFDAHLARPVTSAFLLNHIRARMTARRMRADAEQREAQPALIALQPRPQPADYATAAGANAVGVLQLRH